MKNTFLMLQPHIYPKIPISDIPSVGVRWSEGIFRLQGCHSQPAWVNTTRVFSQVHPGANEPT